MRAAVVWIVSSAFLGCATIEPIHRPPTPIELGHLNEVARESGPLVIETRTPMTPTPTPPCAGAKCPPSPAPPRLTAEKISRADEQTLELVKSGGPASIPLDTVSEISVHRGGRGAAIGAGIGGGIVLFELLGIAAFGAVLQGATNSDPNSQTSSGCDSKCGQAILGLSTVFIGAGALIGAIVGSPRRYPLNLGPATNP